ncbi:Ribosome biogenesis protein SLX9 [Sesbania bispinosa]|nr:Ribosome biogenesis protein SLX9 [Sesbania bispinosa]
MGKTSSRSDSKSNPKFEKKLQFYSKVKDAVASLSAQKSITKKKSKQQRRQNKLKAYNLSSLLESLPELKASRKPGGEDDFKLNCKSRQKLILKEGQRLSAVLKHHFFQADPLSAIHQHLQHTQPVVEEQPKKK